MYEPDNQERPGNGVAGASIVASGESGGAAVKLDPSHPGRRVDALLIAGTAAFGFLAASFAAANSDLWLHLAAGRLIASGDYHFGVDPFSYASEGQYWANHSWLFDTALYGMFRIGGGAILVVLKALMVAALAGLLLRIILRKAPQPEVAGIASDAPVWLAALGTLLAILAASPRLLLQPQSLSLLLLAICLLQLIAGGRSLRLVPVVIAFWVNLDAWFLLGPLLVALFTVADRKRMPRWLLPASILACLASPHHFQALTLPAELSPRVWSSVLPSDPRFSAFFASPWRWGVFGRSSGYGLAAWAFLLLLAGSGLSFLVNFRAARSWRFAVWLPFAALAAWQARLVPFFAVVAGPILALNLGELIGARIPLRIGRPVACLAAIALCVLAWPGWLQSFYSRDRALAWQAEPDASLVRAAERIRQLREQERLAQGQRLYNTSPEAAHYLAWFAPGEQTFLDSRLELLAGAASENRDIGVALGLFPGEQSAIGTTMLRDRGISLVLFSDPNRASLVQGLRKLVERPDRYPIVEVAGNAILVGCDSSWPAMDAGRLAFSSPEASGFPEASYAGPAALPSLPRFWDLAAHRRASHTWEGESAPVFLRLFELGKRTKERPPALPLLAVRASRIGVDTQPRSAEAWASLARGYLHLSHTTWEGATGSPLTLLRYLRHVQVAAALLQAATWNPDSAAVHDLLAGTFAESQFLDLELRHRHEELRVARRGASAGESSEARREQLARIEEAVNRLTRALQDAENRFLVHTNALAGKPLERARIARNFGLIEKAIETLEKSHPDLYGVEGLRLLLDLLLQSGRLEEARILLDREELRQHPDALGTLELPGGVKEGHRWSYAVPAYHWFDFCRSAAAGQYERAAAALERIEDRFLQEERAGASRLGPALAIHLAKETGLSGNIFMRSFAHLARDLVIERLRQNQFMTVERADIRLLGALLHLERGAVPAAEEELSQSLRLYSSVERAALVLPGQALAVRYREEIRKHLNSK